MARRLEASVSPVMVGESAPMQQVHERIRLAAKSKTAVLALGETRTGKAIQGLSADVRRLLVDFCWPGSWTRTIKTAPRSRAVWGWIAPPSGAG